MRKILAIAVLVVLAGAACSGDSSDDAAAETTVPPPTTETTLPPPSGTIEVPFYVIDPSIPSDLTCGEAIPGFNVSFVDESGESTVVEARSEDDSLTDEAVNTTCTTVVVDGEPALSYAAVLDVPAAETYESIALRYPFADGQGSDVDNPVFEMVTRAEAEAGLYVNGAVYSLEPPEDFPLAG